MIEITTRYLLALIIDNVYINECKIGINSITVNKAILMTE